MKKFQAVIGLEIHAELKTKSKMFCSCLAKHFGKKANTQVCPVCLGLPGALPVPNKKAIEATILTGLALNCRIPLFSKFDRKNYFYPDLPKGYQISQYDLPLAQNGLLAGIRIRRVHLEEDTAKMIHTKTKGKSWTLLDFNRAGVALMEVVTEPDLHHGKQAQEFLRKLQQLLRYLKVADADLEKGSLRFEPNISLKKPGQKELPDYKVEIKNLNSFRFVAKAIDFEISRQQTLLEKNQKPKQETRGWDEKKRVTFSQRSKETAQDYRYFPEPDIPPLVWTKADINQLKKKLPELPETRSKRLLEQYQLTAPQAALIAKTRTRADYFEEAVRVGRRHQIKPQQIANVIINKKVDFEAMLPAQLVAILVKKKEKPILTQAQLAKVVAQVLRANAKAATDYRAGKKNALEFLLGEVMKKSQGKAAPEAARQMIVVKLS